MFNKAIISFMILLSFSATLQAASLPQCPPALSEIVQDMIDIDSEFSDEGLRDKLHESCHREDFATFPGKCKYTSPDGKSDDILTYNVDKICRDIYR